MGLSPGTGEQTIMADAVEPVRKHVDEEAADELVCGKVHDGLAVTVFDPVVFPTERDGIGIGKDQAAV